MYQSLIQNFRSMEKEKQDEVKRIYECHYRSHLFKFPFSVRECFAQPVEHAVCRGNCQTIEMGLNPRNPQDFPEIRKFLDSMIGWMQRAPEIIALNPRLQQEMERTLDNFKEFKQEDPIGLFNHIRSLLQAEIEIFDDVQIRKSLLELGSHVNQGEIYLKRILDSPENDEPDSFIINLEAQFRANHQELKKCLTEVVAVKIKKWKREHQTMMSRIVFEKNKFLHFHTILLENIKFWCTFLADVVLKSYYQVVKLLETRPIRIEPQPYAPYFQQRCQDFVTLFHDILKISFIVEDHPQTFRTNEVLKGPLKVTLLVAKRVVENAKVKVFFIDTQQAKIYQSMTNENSIQVFGKFEIKIAGVYLPHTSFSEKMTPNEDQNSFSVIFNQQPCSWKLNSVSRDGKKKKVSNKKYCFFFLCDVRTKIMNFRQAAISFPVVVSTHSSQDDEAKTTIAWDNAFADIERELFEVPEVVPWKELERVLNSKFIEATNRALNRDNLLHLKEKAFRTSLADDRAKEMISWDVLHDKPQNGDAPFWEWFHGALHVITNVKTKLTALWMKGYIAGFIDRNTAGTTLATCDVGTFLLRFSDSVVGGISPVVLVRPNAVVHIDPFKYKCLKDKHLAVRVGEIHVLKHLCQGIGNSIKDVEFYDPDAKKSGNKTRKYAFLKAILTIDYESYSYEIVRIPSRNFAVAGSGGSTSASIMNMTSPESIASASFLTVPMDIQHNIANEMIVGAPGPSSGMQVTIPGGIGPYTQNFPIESTQAVIQQFEASNGVLPPIANTMASGHTFSSISNEQNHLNGIAPNGQFWEHSTASYPMETATMHTDWNSQFGSSNQVDIMWSGHNN